jgi:hypothetical protein
MEKEATTANDRNTQEVAMSKTETKADRRETAAFNLFEQAMSIYAEWMTPRRSRQLFSILKRLDKLGYDQYDVLAALHDANQN